MVVIHWLTIWLEELLLLETQKSPLVHSNLINKMLGCGFGQTVYNCNHMVSIQSGKVGPESWGFDGLCVAKGGSKSRVVQGFGY